MPLVKLKPSEVVVDVDPVINRKLMAQFFTQGPERNVMLPDIPRKGDRLDEQFGSLQFEVVQCIRYIGHIDDGYPVACAWIKLV